MEEKREKSSLSMSMSMSMSMAFSDEILNMSTSNICFNNSPLSSSCSIFDMIPPPPPPPPGDDDQKGSSFGSYMDLLGAQDNFTSSSLFDWFLPTTLLPPTTDLSSSAPPTTQIDHPLPSPAASEVLNTPATPISSSISSSSNEANKAAAAENEHEAEDEEDGDAGREDNQDQDQTKKHLKAKKKKQKKQREPRVAFKTKSEVDHLDDGYRWRKYGQKAVKNSPYPRSYYRCTTPNCGVKKRVERSSDDPSVVVTTYEGQHTHPTPVLSRSATLGFMHDASGFKPTAAATGGALGGLGTRHHHFAMSQQHQQFQNQIYNYNNYSSITTPPPLNVVNSGSSNYVNATSFSGFLQNQENYNNHGFVPPSSRLNMTNQGLLRDNWLLQDIVAPTLMMEGSAGEGRS